MRVNKHDVFESPLFTSITDPVRTLVHSHTMHCFERGLTIITSRGWLGTCLKMSLQVAVESKRLRTGRTQFGRFALYSHWVSTTNVLMPHPSFAPDKVIFAKFASPV